MTDYQVHVDVFHGPLDLLLYLVQRAEIDLRNIPIAQVTEQYLRYLDVLQVIDVERAGEFVVMAGKLIELKSKVVLPRAEEQVLEESEDPRKELVRQLIEYKRYKDATGLLDECAERRNRLFARRSPPEPTSKASPKLQPVEIWDLVSAFGRLLRETLTDQAHEVIADHTPIHVYAERIVAMLEENGRQPFSAIFTPPHHRSRLVGTFLAVLELVRGFRLWVEQEESLGEIWLSLAPEDQTLKGT